MEGNIQVTRSRLGELAAMARQTESAERKILARAQDLLSDVEGKISDARVLARSGSPDEKQSYLDLVHERGRLNQVIAASRAVLASK